MTMPTASAACSDPPDAYFKRIAKDTPLIVVGFYEENDQGGWHDEYGRIRVQKVEKGPKALRHRKSGIRTIHYRPRRQRDPMDVIVCSFRPSPYEWDEPLRFFLQPDPLNPGFYNFIQMQSLTDEEVEALR